MKDLLGLMGKAKEMQAKFQAMQDEIATLEATGQSGGGLVRITLTGKFEMKALKIDPSDEIVKASLLTRDGAVVHPQLAGA